MSKSLRFLHDEQSLTQAVWVALKNEIDFEDLKEWSKKEKSMEKFQIFKNKLNENKL